MSRNIGNAIFSANFEPRMAAPLDSRLVVSEKDDLTNPSVWDSGDGNPYTYKGMVVSVINDTPSNNGLYRLTDDDYTESSNWILVGTTDSSGTTQYIGTNGIIIEDNEISLGGIIKKDSDISLMGGKLIFSSDVKLPEDFDVNYISFFEKDGNGNYFVGGDILQYGDTAINRIIKLDSDFKLNTAFNENMSLFIFDANRTPTQIGFFSNGDFIVHVPGSYLDNHTLFKFDRDGNYIDTYTIPTPRGSITKIYITPNDDIFIGIGGFIGNNFIYIYKLNKNGIIDNTFNAPMFSGNDDYGSWVKCVELVDNGNIIISGRFKTLDHPNASDIVVLDKYGDVVKYVSTENIINLGNSGEIFNIKKIDNNNFIGVAYSTYDAGRNLIIKIELTDVGTGINTSELYESTYSHNKTFKVSESLNNGDFYVIAEYDFYYNSVNYGKVIKFNKNGELAEDLKINKPSSGFDGNIYHIISQYNGLFMVFGNITTYDEIDLEVNGIAIFDNNFNYLTNQEIKIRNTLIKYDNNYHIKYDDRTLVDKEYVDSYVESIEYDGESGITVENRKFNLGGIIKKDTEISLMGGGLVFSSDIVLPEKFNGAIKQIKQDRFGNYYVSGDFTEYGTTQVSQFIKLNSRFELDVDFNNKFLGYDFFLDYFGNNTILDFDIFSDGDVLISHRDNTYEMYYRYAITKIKGDGTIDSDFEVDIVAEDRQYLKKILILENNSFYLGIIYSAGAQMGDRIFRFNSDGVRDYDFQSPTLYGNFETNSGIIDMIQLDNGGLLFSHNTTIDDLNLYYFCVIDDNGMIENHFRASLWDSTIVFGDSYPINLKKINNSTFLFNITNQYITQSSVGVGRLELTNNRIHVRYVLQGSNFSCFSDSLEDGSFYVGLKEDYEIEGVNYGKVLKINNNGWIDETVNLLDGGNGFNDEIESIMILDNGLILVLGRFTSYNDIDFDGSAYFDKNMNLVGKSRPIEINKTQIKYLDNYHVDYDDRTLVDKEYVDYKIESLSGTTADYTGTNGVIIEDNEISLGGTIEKNIEICVGDKKIKYTNKDYFNVSFKFDKPPRQLFKTNDNKIIAIGGFTEFNNKKRKVVRFNEDYTEDTSFNVDDVFEDNGVWGVCDLDTILFFEGYYYIYGDFILTHDDGIKYLARFDENWVLDEYFDLTHLFGRKKQTSSTVRFGIKRWGDYFLVYNAGFDIDDVNLMLLDDDWSIVNLDYQSSHQPKHITDIHILDTNEFMVACGSIISVSPYNYLGTGFGVFEYDGDLTLTNSFLNSGSPFVGMLTPHGIDGKITTIIPLNGDEYLLVGLYRDVGIQPQNSHKYIIVNSNSEILRRGGVIGNEYTSSSLDKLVNIFAIKNSDSKYIVYTKDYQNTTTYSPKIWELDISTETDKLLVNLDEKTSINTKICDMIKHNERLVLSGFDNTNGHVYYGNDAVENIHIINVNFQNILMGVIEHESVLVNYHDKYHDKYDNRTLVDKEYVDNKVLGKSGTKYVLGHLTNRKYEYPLTVETLFGGLAKRTSTEFRTENLFSNFSNLLFDVVADDDPENSYYGLQFPTRDSLVDFINEKYINCLNESQTEINRGLVISAYMNINTDVGHIYKVHGINKLYSVLRGKNSYTKSKTYTAYDNFYSKADNRVRSLMNSAMKSVYRIVFGKPENTITINEDTYKTLWFPQNSSTIYIPSPVNKKSNYPELKGSRYAYRPDNDTYYHIHDDLSSPESKTTLSIILGVNDHFTDYDVFDDSFDRNIYVLNENRNKINTVKYIFSEYNMVRLTILEFEKNGIKYYSFMVKPYGQDVFRLNHLPNISSETHDLYILYYGNTHSHQPRIHKLAKPYLSNSFKNDVSYIIERKDWARKEIGMVNEILSSSLDGNVMSFCFFVADKYGNATNLSAPVKFKYRINEKGAKRSGITMVDGRH